MSTGHIDYVIEAQSREDAGKGASRRLRRAGQIPGVVYGAGKPAKSILLDHNKVLHHSEHESFYSSVLKLKIDGKDDGEVLLKGLQRHPFKPKLVHIDLHRIRSDVAIRVHVPLHFTGEDVAPGVKLAGGMVNHMMSDIHVSCLPRFLPESLTVDLSALGMGDSIYLSQIKLPEGVEIVALMGEEPNDLPVAAIHALKATKEDDTSAPVIASAVPASKVKENKDDGKDGSTKDNKGGNKDGKDKKDKKDKK